MRIRCPFCGERDLAEFSYFAAVIYPQLDTQESDVETRHFDAIYLRDNPAGPHDELWYHAWGCRTWLCVTRDTRTHEMLAVEFASKKVASCA